MFSCCISSINKSINKNMNDKLYTNDASDIEDINCLTDIGIDIDWKETIKFVPPIDRGFVIKVYDGDTITIASKLPYKKSPIYRFSVRLNGIDCPEIKSNDSREKECAQIAKKALSDLILHKTVSLKNLDMDKYGRILADVYINDTLINRYMIDNKLAVSYDGGTKKPPNDWMNYYITGNML